MVLYLKQSPPQAFQKGTLKLYDSKGVLVKSMTLKAVLHNKMDVSLLQWGIYFYQMQWENGEIENGKLLVELVAG